jgi:hypothetical protein
VKTGIRLAKIATVYVKRRLRQLLSCKVKVNNWYDVYLKA